MKTIITTLPIYDKMAKQCYARSRRAVTNKMVPIISPQHRLPSFQWKEESGATSIASVELINTSYDPDNITETIVVTTWASSSGFDSITLNVLTITNAINSAGVAYVNSNTFETHIGDTIRIRGTLTLNSGAAPLAVLSNITPVQLTNGYIDITLECNFEGTDVLMFYNNSATNYTFTGVSIVRTEGTLGITYLLPEIPALASGYFSSGGGALKQSITSGLYCLKILMNNNVVYYSEWFLMDCVYDYLTLTFPADQRDYDDFQFSNGEIVRAMNTAGTAGASSEFDDSMDVIYGEEIKVSFFLTLDSGELPQCYLVNTVGGTISNIVNTVAGSNEITLIPTTSAAAVLMFHNTGAADWGTSRIWMFRNYSTKYLTLSFFNTCNVGNILYANGFIQTLWFESETMENSYPQEEEGQKNGENQFVRTFARQVKKYLARTKEMPDYMVDVFNRMKLHDNIEITNLVGDVYDLYNLETEHEWLHDDKYYAKLDLTFDYDEAVVIGACCENILGFG